MNRGLRREISLLALWAVLMFALLPTAGRLWGSRANEAHAQHGFQHRAHGAHGAHGQGEAPHTDGDCDYCALASGLAPLQVPSLVLLRYEATARDGLRSAGMRALDASPGLGARGPPRHG